MFLFTFYDILLVKLNTVAILIMGFSYGSEQNYWTYTLGLEPRY